jgi:hypothetical protein
MPCTARSPNKSNGIQSRLPGFVGREPTVLDVAVMETFVCREERKTPTAPVQSTAQEEMYTTLTGRRILGIVVSALLCWRPEV